MPHPGTKTQAHAQHIPHTCAHPCISMHNCGNLITEPQKPNLKTGPQNRTSKLDLKTEPQNQTSKTQPQKPNLKTEPQN